MSLNIINVLMAARFISLASLTHWAPHLVWKGALLSWLPPDIPSVDSASLFLLLLRLSPPLATWHNSPPSSGTQMSPFESRLFLAVWFKVPPRASHLLSICFLPYNLHAYSTVCILFVVFHSTIINFIRRNVGDSDLSCILMCLEWCLACNKGSISPGIKGMSQSG